MKDEKERWVSMVTPRFFADRDGVTVVLLMVKERSVRGECLEGR